MSDNLPARQSVDLLAVAQQAGAVKELGAMLIESGLLPQGIKKPESAAAVMLKGEEIGIGPMHALDSIDVIQGNPTISAELMRALVQRAGHKFRVREETAESCTVEGVRRDDPGFAQRATYTMEDARRAGVVGKENWKKHPHAMLLARATGRLCRAMFADVIAGCSYMPEELGGSLDEKVEASEDEFTAFEEPPEQFRSGPRAVEGEVAKQLEARDEREGEAEVETVDDSIEHERHHESLVTEVQRIYYRIPVEARPDYDTVMEWAERGVEEAGKALARVRRLAEEAGMLPGEDPRLASDAGVAPLAKLPPAQEEYA